mmetsp:Transcript_16372/g.36179  ORF Transcript_16372/g.36179 Transcript_16372/m.36179 type:complete len:161 (+) Transcript_16372:81-563(+)
MLSVSYHSMALRSLALLLCLCLRSCLALTAHPNLALSKTNMTQSCSGVFSAGEGATYLDGHVNEWYYGSTTVMSFIHPRISVAFTDFDPSSNSGHYIFKIASSAIVDGTYTGAFEYVADSADIPLNTAIGPVAFHFCKDQEYVHIDTKVGPFGISMNCFK